MNGGVCGKFLQHVQALDQIGGNVRIGISDTGVGIDEELLPHIFERFRQGKGMNAGEGLGLGLRNRTRAR